MFARLVPPLRRIERDGWIAAESRLRFKEWLDLFTDDLFYFMPRRMNVQKKDMALELSQVGDLAIFEDDKTYLPDPGQAGKQFGGEQELSLSRDRWNRWI